MCAEKYFIVCKGKILTLKRNSLLDIQAIKEKPRNIRNFPEYVSHWDKKRTEKFVVDRFWGHKLIKTLTFATKIKVTKGFIRIGP